MIKNIFIGLLVLAVIALCWLTFYGTPEDRAALSYVTDKLDDTREQINNIYEAASEEAEPAVKNSPLDNKRDAGKTTDQTSAQAQIQESNVENNPGDRKEVQGKRESGPSAIDVLNNIHQGKKGNPEMLTDKELSAVLSILKSAQDVLKKTACVVNESSQKNLSSAEESTKTTAENPQTTIIKKKLSTGLAESE